MAQTGGVSGEVTVEEERIIRPHAHHFGVRGAETQRIDPHQDLFGPQAGSAAQSAGWPFTPNALQPRPTKGQTRF